MWHNHSSLCSASHCFTSDASPSPYKPPDKFLFLLYISFFIHIIFITSRMWARSTVIFVIVCISFYFNMCYLFSLIQDVWRSTLICHSSVCFVALLLKPHERIQYVNINILKLYHRTQNCKYGPLNARAFISYIPVSLKFILAATFFQRI